MPKISAQALHYVLSYIAEFHDDSYSQRKGQFVELLCVGAAPWFTIRTTRDEPPHSWHQMEVIDPVTQRVTRK